MSYHHPRKVRYSERYHEQLSARAYIRVIKAPLPDKVVETLANSPRRYIMKEEELQAKLAAAWQEGYDACVLDEQMGVDDAAINPFETGCCSTCKGTGNSNDIETNGKCWDCYGTGHCHEGPCGR